MAYGTRRKTRTVARRTSSRSGAARRTSYGARGRGTVRRSTRRASSGGARTIRIVIEQPSATAVSRPMPIGMAAAATPRKAAF